MNKPVEQIVHAWNGRIHIAGCLKHGDGSLQGTTNPEAGTPNRRQPRHTVTGSSGIATLRGLVKHSGMVATHGSPSVLHGVNIFPENA